MIYRDNDRSKKLVLRSCGVKGGINGMALRSDTACMHEHLGGQVQVRVGRKAGVRLE